MAGLGTVTSKFLDKGMDEPFFVGGSGVSSLVPGAFDISLAGHPYNIDTQYEAFRRESLRSQSIAAVADKTDISNIPGRAAVNTESLWRREMEDWSYGAGQEFLDRQDDQDRFNRFLKSKGIYPWRQNYASLMNDVVQVHNSTTELQVIVVGKFVFINDAGTVKYASGNLSSWTTLTGCTANTGVNNALATDGNTLYIACGSSGVYTSIVTSSVGSVASWLTGTVNSCWFAGGQFLCAAGNKLYSVWIASTASATALTAAGPSSGTALLFTSLVPNFVFSSCAAGNSWIYVGGYTSNTSANYSIIYKLQVNTSGTAMTVPVTGATLPGGELVYALFAYANFILVGTSLGARFCETLGVNDPGGSAGDLKMGPIVPDQIQQVTQPVAALTGQFRFVWFGWGNYDATSTGLGRMDLSTFIDSQAPAYTSDLMVAGNGNVTSMDWYNGLNNIVGVNTGSPIFVVAGVGVYTAASTYVPQGIIDTGYITFGLPDNKVGLQFDFNAKGTAGSVGAVITVDDNAVGAYTVGAQTVSNIIQKVSLPTMVGELFDVQLQINSGSSNTMSPLLRRFQIKAWPAVVSGTQYILPLQTSFSVLGKDGQEYPMNPTTEFLYLDAFRQAGTPVTLQVGAVQSVQVIIKELDKVGYSRGPGTEGGFNEVLVAFCSSIEN